jgi:hypothetical protein
MRLGVYVSMFVFMCVHACRTERRANTMMH